MNGTPSDRIDGGTIRDSNLFHSFSEFNIQNGRAVYFTNPEGITNIFSRITANNPSNINGILGVLGNANLFLLNPNGIIFGPNARLDLNGSFIGTTASSIKFADGVEFSATNPSETALLTVSVPIGLQMGQTPGIITVQNTGHRLIEGNAPLQMGTTPSGLGVAPGKILALVGGDIALEGGILTAPSGHIELGSARSGTVNLSTASPGWNFDYSTPQYGDIRFSRQALADASGAPAGSIHFQGKNISVNQGSVALLINQGDRGSGGITVNASDFLEMRGVGINGFTQNLLVADTITGAGGNLVITAPRLLVQDGGKISTRTFGSGTGGNNSVAADSIQISGFSALKPTTTFSWIDSETFSAGRAGDVQITTRQLSLQEGGAISSLTRGTGATGNVIINASESIELTGETPITFSASLLGAVSFNRGNAGKVTINTPRLSVQNGAGVTATTLGQGDAGTLRVNVSEQITVSGVSGASGKPSNISASATVLPLVFQQAFGLPALPTGNSGDLIVNTPRLDITDGGVVRVNHQGVGDAGNLDINADTIALDRSGTISATTNSGQGGSINLQSNALILRHGSNAIATAGGTGNGGNIAINSPIIVGLENSGITANAFQGKGGNIQINTEGIFLAPDSDITASSQLGVSGTVSISNLNLHAQNLVVLPSNTFVNQAPVIASSCLNQRNAQQGRFVVTGNGGLSETPDNLLMPYETVQVRSISQLRQRENSSLETTNSRQLTNRIQEATGFNFTSDGKVALLVDKDKITSPTDLTCSS
ncbi:filamentous hemagglutinin N-terminal domain-containing protein [Aerosakkonema sp. BLCC-F183]|uniref:two-partner secretion domain-containing protein n=1 Tax=Aerosakkonema sp. BLCC-F183 TaxID=3342834 RepID=UPI0035B96089